jgi:hypothetical protein
LSIGCARRLEGRSGVTDECFPSIYRHTDGVPRRINSLCSRLLLFGLLEGSHTISAADADQVAAELRTELSAVTASGGIANGAGVPFPVVENTLPLAAISERLGNLERMTAGHDRTLRRVIELIASYIEKAEANELR